MSRDYLWLWLIPAALAGLFLWFSFLGFMVARAGGWADMARTHPAGERPAHGVTYGWQGGRINWLARYMGSLRATLAREGFYLAGPRLFRWSHPPLRMSWDELKIVAPLRKWSGGLLALQFVDAEGRTLTITLPERALADLRELSGRADLLANFGR